MNNELPFWIRELEKMLNETETEDVFLHETLKVEKTGLQKNESHLVEASGHEPKRPVGERKMKSFGFQLKKVSRRSLSRM